jgi:Mor family transcriptional regulator
MKATMSEEIPKGRLAWVAGAEIADLLQGDLKMIDDYCGREVLISLLENFGSMTLYISQKPLTEARRRYVRAHYDGGNVKELCRTLGCSERFIYEVLAEKMPRPAQ